MKLVNHNEVVRTRFAPSPTGNLHIGGARTALFNYLFARHYYGKFFLRIDNTDINRNQGTNNIESIIESLRKLNIKWDNADNLYYQLEHLNEYKALADQLIEQGDAYRCFCTVETLEKSIELQKKQGIKNYAYARTCRDLSALQIKENLASKQAYTIRFKVDSSKTYQWEDLARGKIIIHASDIEDFIILRNNNIPTFHLATLYDDHFLKITHILRGEEHITNTAKHLAMAEALKWDPPAFGHLSIILDKDGKKMSKRSKEPLFFIKNFIENKFLFEAIVNYLALLGWTPDKYEEVFSFNELIERFDGENLVKSSCHFDKNKLLWMNQNYIRNLPDETIVSNCLPLLENHYQKFTISSEVFQEIIIFFKDKMLLFTDIIELANEVLTNQYLASSLVAITKEQKKLLSSISKILNLVTNWTQSDIKDALVRFCTINNFKKKDVFLLLRKIISNTDHGPNLFFMLQIWTKSTLLDLINQYTYET